MAHLMAAAVRLGAGLAALAFVGASADADEPFYKGKRLTVMVNYSAGGPADIEGRVFARHIGRHIDGSPTVIVQNVDGAGGLVGTMWLGEIAPKDGTAMGHLTGVAWRWANDPEHFRVNFLTYEFLGYQGSTTVYYVRTDVTPGVRVAGDLLKAKGLVSGGLAPDSSKDLSIRLGFDLLGLPYQHVTGYRSSAHARLALQQREINFFGESPPSYRGVVMPGLVKDGTVIPVWHDPENEGERLVPARQISDLGIPPFHTFFHSVKGVPPTGPLWDAYNTVRTIGGTMLRVLALPPGAPPAAVQALQTALARLSTDRDYAADAIKTIGFVPDYTTGANTNKEVRDSLAVSPQMRAFIAAYIKRPGR